MIQVRADLPSFWGKYISIAIFDDTNKGLKVAKPIEFVDIEAAESVDPVVKISRDQAQALMDDL